MVEAFYGDDSRLQHNTAIAHTAAEHARAALRVATPLETPLVPASNQYNPEEDESLFKWLGIVEPPPPVLPGDGDGSGGDGAAGEEEEEWTLPFADYEIEESPEVLPTPSLLWTPWPSGRRARRQPKNRGGVAAADPATRVVSAVEAFGTVPMRAEVERWVAGSDARQNQLRKLMVSLDICQQGSLALCLHSTCVWVCRGGYLRWPASTSLPLKALPSLQTPTRSTRPSKQAVEERELSKAWVALWGRRLRLDPSTKAWVDNNGGDDAAVLPAARRVVFLEGHPEQVRTRRWHTQPVP